MNGTRKGYVVEPLPSGRFSLRLLYHDGTKKRAGEAFATRDEADGYGRELAKRFGLDAPDGETLASYLTTPETGWLDRREKLGRRATDGVRSIVRTWLAPSPIWTRPLRSITRLDVRRIVLGCFEQRAEQTARNVLHALSSALGAALEDELVRENVARGVKLPKRARTEDPWTFLRGPEIDALLAVALEHEAEIIGCAIGLMVRSGELRALQLRDVHVGESEAHPHVVVRFGDIGKPTKSGKPRRIEVNGFALQAMRAWLRRLPAHCQANDRGLAFPTERGNPRAKGHILGRVHVGDGVYVDRFAVLAVQAGLFDADPERPLVWHSLRHTGASALVSGTWGRRWSLEEVKEILGHKDIKTTQRYAHLAEDALKEAARATPGPRGSHGGGDGGGIVQDASRFLNRRSQVRFLLGAPEKTSADLAPAETRVVLAWEVVAAVQALDGIRAEHAARRLASFVAAHAFVDDALAVLDEGPLMLMRALALAERVLAAETSPAKEATS